MNHQTHNFNLLLLFFINLAKVNKDKTRQSSFKDSTKPFFFPFAFLTFNTSTLLQTWFLRITRTSSRLMTFLSPISIILNLVRKLLKWESSHLPPLRVVSIPRFRKNFSQCLIASPIISTALCTLQTRAQRTSRASFCRAPCCVWAGCV